MVKFFRNSLKARLTAFFMLFAAIPLLTAWWMSAQNLQKIANDEMGTLRGSATTISDRIERNLFERYGDVQAFGLNAVVQDKASWYQSGDSNKVAAMMNNYMSTYTPVYQMMMLVDTTGKDIAVSSVDYKGKAADTSKFTKCTQQRMRLIAPDIRSAVQSLSHCGHDFGPRGLQGAVRCDKKCIDVLLAEFAASDNCFQCTGKLRTIALGAKSSPK